MICQSVNPCGQVATDHVCTPAADGSTVHVDMCMRHAVGLAAVLESRGAILVALSSAQNPTHWYEVAKEDA